MSAQHLTSLRCLELRAWKLDPLVSLEATIIDCKPDLRDLLAPTTYDLTVSHCLKQRTESPREMCELLNYWIVEPALQKLKKKKKKAAVCVCVCGVGHTSILRF